jgi:hypothetical protein
MRTTQQVDWVGVVILNCWVPVKSLFVHYVQKLAAKVWAIRL